MPLLPKAELFCCEELNFLFGSRGGGGAPYIAPLVLVAAKSVPGIAVGLEPSPMFRLLRLGLGSVGESDSRSRFYKSFIIGLLAGLGTNGFEGGKAFTTLSFFLSLVADGLPNKSLVSFDESTMKFIPAVDEGARGDFCCLLSTFWPKKSDSFVAPRI